MNGTEPTDEKNAFGLDKNARLEAKRVKEEDEERPEPPDPPFPYRVIKFDPVMVTGIGN